MKTQNFHIIIYSTCHFLLFQHPVNFLDMLIQLSGIWRRSPWSSEVLWQWFGMM
jgi:hypothetical protein